MPSKKLPYKTSAPHAQVLEKKFFIAEYFGTKFANYPQHIAQKDNHHAFNIRFNVDRVTISQLTGNSLHYTGHEPAGHWFVGIKTDWVKQHTAGTFWS